MTTTTTRTTETTMTTSQTTTATLEERLAPLAARLADIQAKRADLDEQEKAVKAAIRDLVPGPDTYGAGGLTVSVQPNRRFNPELFMALYPVTTHPQFYKLTPDTTAVRGALAPDEYARFMAPVGDDKIALR